MLRTHGAGTLRKSDAGRTVELAGWVSRRRDHGGVAFIDLRDATGSVQVVIRDEKIAGALRAEWCIKIVGEVLERPSGNENSALDTGDIEVMGDQVIILIESAPLPFPIGSGDDAEINEEVRLRYRYLDLRREKPAHNLRLRSKVTSVIRSVMDEQEFLDIETPYLTRSTPEGARDFLVPVRLQPGSWYALPQSPQLFKQLLMVAGMEKYYQIARCFRDEDFRADRQPEFTQLDIEMSFIDQEDILTLTEKLLLRVWKEVIDYDITLPIRRMTYADAMTNYGSDKPDLRFGQQLREVTSFFSETQFRVFQAPYVGAVAMPGGASSPRRELDAWQEWAKTRGAKGLAYILLNQDGTLAGPVAKNLSEVELSGIAAAAGANAGDAIFFAAGEKVSSQSLLGAVRLEIGKRCNLIADGTWEFLWVLDAPMFEPTDDGGWTAVHHPFTGPKPEFAETFADKPGEALAYAYDIVLNGNELGGGSIRIHDREMQRKVFKVIGLSDEEAASKFGFLLEAFNYGPPPHGGIALGLDRVCALLTNSDSIREVIAFPKTASGGDPLTGAPTPITPAQRKESGIDAVTKRGGK
jgi:aspartyl-tRNA synthetase